LYSVYTRSLRHGVRVRLRSMSVPNFTRQHRTVHLVTGNKPSAKENEKLQIQ